MRIKEFVSDTKNWIWIIVVIAAIILAVVKIVNLPQRVEKAEEKIAVNEEGIEKVAETFDKYMMRQMVIEEEQNKREELMLEIIKDK